MKYIWCAYFHEIISKNLQFGIDFLVFTYPLMFKQKISKFSLFFFEIHVNFWLLCAHLVMTIIIRHFGRLTCQQKVCYGLGFYVSGDFRFSHLEELKSTFFTSLHFAHDECTKEFQVLGIQKSCKELKKSKKFHIRGSKLQLRRLEIPIFI